MTKHVHVCAGLLALLVACAAPAVEITQEQARTAVCNWLARDPALGCPLGRSVSSVRTCSSTNGATFHVVRLAGGGFVVTSADTAIEPVIAFSDSDDLVEGDRNPLWTMLTRDLAARARERSTPGGAALLSVSPVVSDPSPSEKKWAKLLSSASLQGVASVSDVRVAPLVQSRWDQEGCNSGNCYNYYTPNNYCCGCVATAAAQMMRYFQWPKATTAIARSTCRYCTVDGAQKILTTQGGCYDWSQMPFNPNLSGTTEANRQMIGKLTSDIGIICGMDYTSDGSGAGGYMLQFVFPKFGYSNVVTYYKKNTDVSYSADMRNALLSNFDAKLPVMVSIDGSFGGHAIVGDGYGYSDDTLYIHLNYGWSGLGNAWYAPPDLSAGGLPFNMLNGFVYNVYTNQPKGSVICSGRVLSASGAPVAGVSVRATLSGEIQDTAVTDEKGIYALYLTGSTGGKNYSLTATYGNYTAADSVVVKTCTTMDLVPDGKTGYGSYYISPTPTVGNMWGKNLVLPGLSSVETPILSPADCTFWPTTNVVISCATTGVTIRYTLDGEDPTETSSVYSSPIAVTTTTTIKARAYKSGHSPSAVVSAVYTYDITRDAPEGDYFANPIQISGESGSYVVADNSRYTLEDGEPWHTLSAGSYYNQAKTIWYEWMAPQKGTVSFTTKCYQTTINGNTIYTSRRPTYVAVYLGTNLDTATRLALSSDIQQRDYTTTVTCDVEEGMVYRIVGMVGNDNGTGAFTLSWSGEYETVQTKTSTTEVPVPYAWLDEHFPVPTARDPKDYERLASEDADGDGFMSWQEYVLDTDPNDPASAFTVSIRLKGTTPVVEWSHTNAVIESLGYRYVPKGKGCLADPLWSDFDARAHRFFKVVVEPLSGR